jgi:hypothetical protein
MTPNLIIPGIPKSGTTYFLSLLNQSPQIFARPGFESKFFYYDKLYSKGFDFYKKSHNTEKKCEYIVDNSNIYIYSEEAIKRIYLYNPNVKLIILMRNPIDRAFSEYNYRKNKGTEYFSFSMALKLEPFWRAIPHRTPKNLYSYIYRGIYIKHIKVLLKYFNIEQMHFIVWEKLLDNTKIELNRVCDFLDINNSFIDEFDTSDQNYRNATKLPRFTLLQLPIMLYKRFYIKHRKRHQPKTDAIIFKIESWNLSSKKVRLKMKPQIRKKLKLFFDPYNNDLSKLIGQDLNIWD